MLICSVMCTEILKIISVLSWFVFFLKRLKLDSFDQLLVSDNQKLWYNRERAFKNLFEWSRSSNEVVIHCRMRTFFEEVFKSTKIQCLVT